MHPNVSNINLFADILSNISQNKSKTTLENAASQNNSFFELIDNLLQKQEPLSPISGGNNYVENSSNLEDNQTLKFFNLIKKKFISSK